MVFYIKGKVTEVNLNEHWMFSALSLGHPMTELVVSTVRQEKEHQASQPMNTPQQSVSLCIK